MSICLRIYPYGAGDIKLRKEKTITLTVISVILAILVSWVESGEASR